MSGWPTRSICIGPPPAAESYLDPWRSSAATISSTEAIHPGPCNSLGKRRLRHRDGRGTGSSSCLRRSIRMMGDKITAKKVCNAGIRSSRSSDGPVANEDEARGRRDGRLPGHGQGSRRRWRTRHEGGGRRGGTGAGDGHGARRGMAAFSSSELYLESLVQPRHRSANSRGPARNHLPSGRTRLLSAATSPEGPRGGALPRSSTAKHGRASGDSRRRQRQI